MPNFTEQNGNKKEISVVKEKSIWQLFFVSHPKPVYLNSEKILSNLYIRAVSVYGGIPV